MASGDAFDRCRRAPSAMLGNALFVLFIGGVLVYGGGLAWYMLDRFDLVGLVASTQDDAFYYFQIAWHLAEGRFSTFDGGITRTNGYHPLWLLLITPFYWMFDKETALFAIRALEIVLIAGGVALVAVAARLARLPWFLLFAALPALYRQHGMFIGLEAAAGLFMLGLFFFTIALFARDTARWRWPLAVAAFALPWVRLEYAAISLAATAALLFIEWSWQDRPPPEVRARSLLACKAVGPLLAAGAGLLAYFGYNGVVFGGIVPVSASVKRLWSEVRWEQEGGYDLTRNVHDYLRMYAFDDELWVVLAIFVCVLLVWWFAHRTRSREGWLLLAFLAGVFGLAAGHLAKFVQSVLTVHPYFGSYDWYFIPAYLMTALVVPAGCYSAIWFVRRFAGPRLPRASGIMSLGVVIAGAVTLYSLTDFDSPFRFVDRKSGTTVGGTNISNLMGVMVMDRVLPEGSVVGSWDAGVIGYFSRFPVVNLDGLANSWSYFHADYSAGKDEIPDMFEQRIDVSEQPFGITHFANMGANMGSPGVHDASLFQGSPCCFYTSVIHRFDLRSNGPREGTLDGIGHSDWFWERMRPHFWRQTDGIGTLRDGRLVQTFARECEPGAELVTWTWGRRGDETVSRPWVRMESGACVSAMVLPHGAFNLQVAGTASGEYLTALDERQPDIRSDFDVRLVGNRLVYVKEACAEDDVDGMFYLHLEPVRPDDLPDFRRPYGFGNYSFGFGSRGARFGEACWAEVPLPDYDVAAIRTGQYVKEGGRARNIWKGRIRLYAPVAGMTVGEYLAELTRRQPDIRSDFDVYLVGNHLVYVKEACTEGDVDGMFFLFLEPVRPDDLPDLRRPYGFGNHSFRFDRYGARFGEACWAEVPLPDYDVAAIRTGQYVKEGGRARNIWKGRIRLYAPVAGMTVGEYLAELTRRQPDIRSDFDVHLVGNRLVYVKEACTEGDVDGMFFLFLEPVRPDDLPDLRRPYGFDNYSFGFGSRGARFGEACWAEVPLPDYDVAAIRTGQYVEEGGRARNIWEGRIRLE